MTLQTAEIWGALLLFVPAGYSFVRLCLARLEEYKAGREDDPSEKEFMFANANRLAGAASLFPFPVLLLLGAGLLIQLGVLAAKILG